MKFQVKCKQVYDDGDIVFTNGLLGDKIFIVGFSIIGEKRANKLREQLVKAKIERVD